MKTLGSDKPVIKITLNCDFKLIEYSIHIGKILIVARKMASLIVTDNELVCQLSYPCSN